MAKDRARIRRLRRNRRHARVRKKIRGTADRPRLVVRRTLRHIEGQLVDDERGVTLLGVSSLALEVEAGEDERSGKVSTSFTSGKLLAERARAAGIAARVVFDRGGYRYHGRVKAFADGARKGGLEF